MVYLNVELSCVCKKHSLTGFIWYSPVFEANNTEKLSPFKIVGAFE